MEVSVILSSKIKRSSTFGEKIFAGRLREIAKKESVKIIFFLKSKNKISEGCKILVNVAIVSEEEIQRWNMLYRNTDKPTDVLSFGYEFSERVLNGEILLCPKVIEKYAKKDDADFINEFRKNLIHGFLHIVGFNHGKEMFDLQEEILK